MKRGWEVTRIHDTQTMVRLVVRGSEELLLDLAVDTPAQSDPPPSSVGPTFSIEELAARKLLALFDRAEARDFADVYALREVLSRQQLMLRAAALDRGFDAKHLALSLRAIARFRDEELPVPPKDAAALRTFFEKWLRELLEQ